ncbi:MAG: hypothetical protein N3E38_01830 [Candidatus Aenigmarchaeota archaeon]|nr:hypothetical protein [Candidatus Aenigmarchaeota archaeon]
MLVIILIFLTTMRINECSDFTSLMNISFSPSRHYYLQTSKELSKGIMFTNFTGSRENIQYPLVAGSKYNNATWNYNVSNGETEYWLYIFVVGGEIDLCHGASSHLCSTPNCENNFIEIENVKWSISYENNINFPSLAAHKKLSLGFDKIVTNVREPTTIYFRYWLNVPPNSPASAYNTTYQIMAVVSGYDC